MFVCRRERMGALEKLVFAHPSGTSMTVLPETGGIVAELRLGDGGPVTSVLRGPRTDAEAIANPSFLGAWMVPFANRVRHGEYRFANVAHRLARSDVLPAHALHGLVARAPMHVRTVDVSVEKACLELELLFAGAEGYPFPFELGITYELSSARGLATRCEVRNAGSFAMPVVFGWHPYFELIGGRAAYELRLPPGERLELDGECIPTQRRLPTATSFDLARSTLDDCFALDGDAGTVETVLHAKDGSRDVVVWQEVGGRYDFLQVYTPSEPDVIAIEPMTGAIDAFNNGIGLRTLAPKERASASAGVFLRSPR